MIVEMDEVGHGDKSNKFGEGKARLYRKCGKKQVQD
jgi:hypothetical protein